MITRIKSDARPDPTGAKWVIKRLLRAGGVGVLFGPPGAGKSTVAVDIACHVGAYLHDWHGHKIAGGPVVIVAGEDADGVLAMLQAWEQHHDHSTEVDVIEGVVSLEPTFNGPAPDFDAILAEIDAAAKDYSAASRLVIMDTMASMWTDETNGGLAVFLSLCRAIAATTGAAVLIIHHSGKDSTKGERGGSALRGGVDLSLEVERGGEVGCIEVVKCRGAPTGDKYGYRLETVDLGTDEDGDPVTACVAVAAAAPSGTPLRSVNQKIVLRGLIHAIAVHANGEAHVTEEQWREVAYRMLPDSDDNKRQSFRRARDSLIDKGYVTFIDGLAALSPDAIIPPEIRRRVDDIEFAVH